MNRRTLEFTGYVMLKLENSKIWVHLLTFINRTFYCGIVWVVVFLGSITLLLACCKRPELNYYKKSKHNQ